MNDAPLSGANAGTSVRPPERGGRRSWSVGVVVGALLLSGCATKADLRDVRSEIVGVQEIAARQDSILQTLLGLQRATQDSLAVQSDILFTIRGDLNRQILEIQEQLVTIQELTGQGQRALAGLRDQVEARRTAIVQEEQTQDTSDAGGGDLPPGVDRSGPEELYNVAVTQFNRGSLNTARRAFEQFLTAFPGHPLADDAHYYLGDVLVQDNRIDEAIEAFLEIPELFPAGNRVPDALYRAGALQAELENYDEARALFERVVNTYPDSGVAILAEERLNELP